jgi:hypothetical protein
MSALLMRHYISLMNSPNAQFVAYLVDVSNDTRGTLLEGRLTEAAFIDRVKTIAKKISNKYDDIKYSMLASATNKAMNMFGDNPAIKTTLGKIAKVGKMAIANRALLAILIGMVGTLIGYAHNAAAVAQTAAKLDAALHGTSVDEIIKHLDASGIHIDTESGSSGSALADIVDALPPNVGHQVESIAKALRAIEAYKFKGDLISSNSEFTQHAHTEGFITKSDQTYHSVITSKTLDGELTLAKMEVTQTTGEDGQTHFENQLTGIQPDLEHVIGQIPADQQETLRHFIQAGNPMSNVESQSLLDQIKGIFDYKTPAIAGLIAAAVMKKPNGRYRFQITPSGVKVVGSDAIAKPATAAPAAATGSPATSSATAPAAPARTATAAPSAPAAPVSAPVAPPVARAPAQPTTSTTAQPAQPALQPAQPAQRRPTDNNLWRQSVNAFGRDPSKAQQIADHYKSLGGTWAAPPAAAPSRRAA